MNMKKLLLSLVTLVLLVPAGAKTDLSKYVIVYPAAAEAEEGAGIAAEVAAAVARLTGVTIPVVTDETPAVKKEILVGRTTRPESAAFYDGQPDTFDYYLGLRGGKLVVAGGGCWALMRAVERLGAGVPRKAETGNIYGEFLFQRAEGTNLRILDDNIWDYGKDVNTPEWAALGADCSDPVRARGLLEVVWAFLPDIVTLQEYGPNMDQYLRPELEARGYRMAYIPGEVWNHTPIFYNPKSVTLKETRYHKYEPADWSNKGSKSYNSALFTLNENGKEFMVINTHLWWKSEKARPGSNEARAAQVRKMMTEADDAVFTHGCPVFMMGDMNCKLDSKAMKQLLAAGYKPLHRLARISSDPRCGHHECNAKAFSRKENKTNEDGMGCIDQFLLYNGNGEIHGKSATEILVFQRIYAYFTVELTDHYPNYADITLR